MTSGIIEDCLCKIEDILMAKRLRDIQRGIENRDWLNVLKRSAQICAVAGEQTVED